MGQWKKKRGVTAVHVCSACLTQSNSHRILCFRNGTPTPLLLNACSHSCTWAQSNSLSLFVLVQPKHTVCGQVFLKQVPVSVFSTEISIVIHVRVCSCESPLSCLCKNRNASAKKFWNLRSLQAKGCPSTQTSWKCHQSPPLVVYRRHTIEYYWKMCLFFNL